MPLKSELSPDTEEWAGRRRGEEERQRRIWRRSAAIGEVGGGIGVEGGGEKEGNQKRIWRRSAIGVGEEYVGGEWVDEWRRRGERGEDGVRRRAGETGEEVVLRRRPAPGRGVSAMGRRGGIVSYTDFGPIDFPPQRPGFMRPTRPVLDSQGRVGERWGEGKGEREEKRERVEGRGREPPSGPFLRNERGFSGLQQRRSEFHPYFKS